MKRLSLLTLSLCLLAAPCYSESLESAMPFDSIPIPDSELATMRGGLIAGGLHIDFNLVSQLSVNGDVLRNLNIDSDRLQDLQNLQQVLQTGPGNRFDAADVLQNPSVTTVVQNSLDGALIQSFSGLDVVVNNYGEFRSNTTLTSALDGAHGLVR